MVKITKYTKSEIVEIQYGEDPTSYIYTEADNDKLITQLLKIMQTDLKVEVIINN